MSNKRHRSVTSKDAASGSKRQRTTSVLPACVAGTAPAFPANAAKGLVQVEMETDAHKLAQRQKQIDFGKNTIGYDRYIKLVPRSKRSTLHPVTPPAHVKMPKKEFDSRVRKWRRSLHLWDPKEGNEEDADGQQLAHVHSPDAQIIGEKMPTIVAQADATASVENIPVLGVQEIPNEGQELLNDYQSDYNDDVL